MKEKFKKIITPIILSVICGSLCGRLVYNIYSSKTDLSINSNLVYLIQTGAYSSYDSMRANVIGYDYVYYQENDLFKTIIGITKEKDNIEKITSTYNDEVIISKYYISNEELLTKIAEYDKKLKLATDITNIKNIILEMLNNYKNENITLAKVS